MNKIVNIFFILIFLLFINYSNSERQVISYPGLYKLGSNIVFTPTVSNDDIIQISANNVSLDLGGYTISQNPSALLSGINGIVVDSNLSNITIKNGTISHITGTGISIGDGCTHVTLNNIMTYSCDLVGIECFGTDLNPIFNVLMENCTTVSCTQAASLFFNSAVHWVNCVDSIMRNCKINNNFNSGGVILIAAFLEDCQRCNLKNILARNNIANIIFAGIALSGKDNYVQNSTVIDNTVLQMVNGPAGFVIFNLGNTPQRNTLINCFALQNNGGLVTQGFAVDPGCEDSALLYCQSLQNTSSVISSGFGIGGTRNNLLNCIAKGNSADAGVGLAQGFSFSNVSNSTIFKCLAAEQTAATAVGFEVDNCLNCEIKDCKAYLNTGTTDAASFGFRINGGTAPDTGNNQFVANVAGNNGNNAANQMNNFAIGTFTNISYGLLNAVTSPFTNLGVVP